MLSRARDRRRHGATRRWRHLITAVGALAIASLSTANAASPGAGEQKPLGAMISTAAVPTSFRDCEGCPEMVVVPAGSFTMGSPANEPGHSADEAPRHKVEFDRPFAVGKFEVTNGEWNACVANSGCGERGKTSGGARHPATGMSWHEAVAYVAWLSRRTGKKYRLLSEAEWEYAARAGTTTTFHTGMTIGPRHANLTRNRKPTGFKRASGFGMKPKVKQTVPVGGYPANGFGLHDIHGNVWEWNLDCVNDGYVGAPSDGSAWMTGKCHRHIIRGGAWVDYPMGARSAIRSGLGSAGSGRTLGLRVARTID